MNTVKGVSCKSADGFRDDEVYLSVLAILYHFEESLSMGGRCSRYTTVSIHIYEFPIFVFLNELHVVLNLEDITRLLGLFLGAYSAVGSDPQNLVRIVEDELLFRGYDLYLVVPFSVCFLYPFSGSRTLFFSSALLQYSHPLFRPRFELPFAPSEVDEGSIFAEI